MRLIKSNLRSVAAFLLLLPLSQVYCMQCDINDDARFDCLPGSYGSPEESCKARGCCWKPARDNFRGNLGENSNKILDDDQHFYSGIGTPYCFYPKDYMGYNMSSLKETDYGFTGVIQRSTKSGWPSDIVKLSLDVWFETSTRIHIKISDATSKRYEVPIEIPPVPRHKPTTTDYAISFTENPFSLTVTRKSTGALLFDTSVAPLLFADQFIQISTRLDSTYVYGLGEHKSTLLHNSTKWQRMALWARDQAPVQGSNLYGVHPFYMNIENKNRNAHGVFLLNSNAMDVDLTPLPGLTFRTIGGVLDLYIFTGPSSDEVVEQYSNVIGRPQLPPYWSLGFHLCRFDYNSAARLKFIIERNRKIGIPYEVQWNDIDYMRSKLDWTMDAKAYAELPQIIEDLHQHGQKYIVIIDPGISNEQPRGQYKPYDEGIDRSIFIKNSSGQPLIGKVWPGTTVFPDFTHPRTADWWYEMAQEFHKNVPVDGLWIDMNEPSNFVAGSTSGCSGSLDKPPYVPAIAGGGKLESNTLCASAQQYYSSHYNLHNLYGLTEANATNRALEKVLGKRSIVISRSSYPSLSRHAGHWTGDVFSTWEDIYYSIPAILEFQMYVIPMVGADVCGFNGNTNEELCVRWMQLGSFYPFMRNHNDDSSRDQDPGEWSTSAQQIMKTALRIRYALLPFFYTQFYLAHITGRPVIRPLFFLFPDDVQTYGIDDQFLWGTALLISPALKQNQTVVEAYFPAGNWYDAYEGNLTSSGSRGQRLKIDSPLDKINFHIRGGSIVALQIPDTTTVAARQNDLGLWVAYNESYEAEGLLYWDDGEVLDVVQRNLYVLISFTADKNSVTGHPMRAGYKPTEPLKLEHIRCLGVPTQPSRVEIDGQAAHFIYNIYTKELLVTSLSVSLMQPFKLQWS